MVACPLRSTRSLWDYLFEAERSGQEADGSTALFDPGGDPCAPCRACHGLAFHQPPGGPWTCSACEPPRLPTDGAALVGWTFCTLPMPRDPAVRALIGVTGTSAAGELLRGEP